MNSLSFRPLAVALSAAALLLTGCDREAAQPKEITSSQIVGSAPEVFKGASQETQQLASDVVEAINKQDFATAWAKLQDLNVREGLTDAQKQFVAESISSVGAEMQKAESSGNEAAQKALEFHRANK